MAESRRRTGISICFSLLCTSPLLPSCHKPDQIGQLFPTLLTPYSTSSTTTFSLSLPLSLPSFPSSSHGPYSPGTSCTLPPHRDSNGIAHVASAMTWCTTQRTKIKSELKPLHLQELRLQGVCSQRVPTSPSLRFLSAIFTPLSRQLIFLLTSSSH